MSYTYNDDGSLRNNCLIVKPIGIPINIRGLRTDANWEITAINYDLKNNITHRVSCVFWTKKEALSFLKTGVHKCSVTNQTLYKIKTGD